MKVFVDGDACPVLKKVEEICQEHSLELIVVSDTNHLLDLEYGKHIMVDKQRDSSDYVLVNLIEQGDLLITQDYGLASMTLAKRAYILHPLGFEYTSENIDELLFNRYMGAKNRRSTKKKHLSGPPKRTKEDDHRFQERMLAILKKE